MAGASRMATSMTQPENVASLAASDGGFLIRYRTSTAIPTTPTTPT